ncbi:MAG: DUF1131 family protein [Rhodobiaceae bacterium]|nr:DUF1131 family protein [Rhodobiaceae bacterium]MCC0054699.1 DUF1131 family protein [Rhodobiaceae bacterium]
MFVLSACSTEAPTTSGYAPIAPSAPTLYSISSGTAGPVGPGEPFSKRRMQELFPGKDIETISLANEDKTFYGFVVFNQGLQVMAAEPDSANRSIIAMHGVGPAVAGPNGEKIGMTFANAHISPRSCRVGRDLWAGMAICPADHAPNVSLVFYDGNWQSSPDRLPPPSQLASGRLQRIVWTPPAS